MILTESLKGIYAKLKIKITFTSSKNKFVLFGVQVALISVLIATTILIYIVDTGDRFIFYFILLLSLIIVISIALIFNLKEKYKISLVLTLVCILITPWISILLDKTVFNGDFAPLYFIVLSITFSAIFLSEFATALITIIQLTLLILLLQSSPVLIKGNWPSLISYVVISSVVGIVISYVNRKQLIQINNQNKFLMNNELKLNELSIRDPLTGLYNRRYMEEVLERVFNQQVINNQSIGIILMDVDKFKKINDTCGHLVGDSVLKQIAEILQNNTRESDIVCRFGGDEIIMILLDCSLEKAYQKAVQIRSVINKTKIKIDEVYDAQVNLSFGVAALPENGITVRLALKAADNALYDAKNTGGNRIIVSKSCS